MNKPENILPGKGLLLVEGADEKYFFIRACDAYGKKTSRSWILAVLRTYQIS